MSKFKIDVEFIDQPGIPVLIYLVDDYSVSAGHLELRVDGGKWEHIPFTSIRRWWVTDLTATAPLRAGAHAGEDAELSVKTMRTEFNFWINSELAAPILQKICEEVVDLAIGKGAIEAECYIPCK